MSLKIRTTKVSVYVMKTTYGVLGIVFFLGAGFWFAGGKNLNMQNKSLDIRHAIQKNKEEWKPLFGDNNYKYVIKDKSVPASKIFSFQDGRINVLYRWPQKKGPPIGMIVTKKKYQSYNLEFEFKWGLRHFKPRLDQKKDAGVVFHAITTKQVWPPSLEYQIQEGDVGDLWAILGAHCEVVKNGKTIEIAREDYSRSKKFINAEKQGWNKVRLEVRGRHARYLLNGRLVNEIKNATYNGNILKSGHIGLQAEYAEISYQNIRIQELTDKN